MVYMYNNIMDVRRIAQYAVFLVMFAVSQLFSMWGQYHTIKYPSMSYSGAIVRSLPYAWLEWMFVTLAVSISHAHNLVTPMQDVFLLIVFQFVAVVGISRYWLHLPTTQSDILAFILVLLAFGISFGGLASRWLGRPAPTPGISRSRRRIKVGAVLE